jgi:uncharacterized protein with von Willebrand factor type A (vWA) domain
MLVDFFLYLRQARLPVSIQELLTLLQALRRDVIGPSIDEFYYLARATLVKDEALFDRFDRAFGEFFRGVQAGVDLAARIPEDWLRRALARELTALDASGLQKLGWDRLFEQFRKRLEEQNGAHHGGSKWIGTGGTSPFGHGGRHPEGIRIEGPSNGNRSALKAWQQRAYRDYDDQVELGTRNIKIALRRLRRFAREGADLELDLADTIRSTAHNGGHLQLKLVPERHNAVKVLMLLDVGGSMDEHVDRVQELFSAARAEFKRLEFLYFHNCVYENLWRANRRRFADKTETLDVLRRYSADHRLVFVGDATMAPYEILQPGGSLEHDNAESGAAWLARLTAQFPRFAWINPEPEGLWPYRQSVAIIQQLMGGRMVALTLDGLRRATALLSR